MSKSLILAVVLVAATLWLDQALGEDVIKMKQAFYDMDDEFYRQCKHCTPEQYMELASKWLERHKSRTIKLKGRTLEKALEMLTNVKKLPNLAYCSSEGREILDPLKSYAHIGKSACKPIIDYYTKKLNRMCSATSFDPEKAMAKLTKFYEDKPEMAKFSSEVAKTFIDFGLDLKDTGKYSVDFSIGKVEPEIGDKFSKGDKWDFRQLVTLEFLEDRYLDLHKNFEILDDDEKGMMFEAKYFMSKHFKGPCTDLVESLKDNVFLPSDMEEFGISLVKQPPKSDVYQLSKAVYELCTAEGEKIPKLLLQDLKEEKSRRLGA